MNKPQAPHTAAWLQERVGEGTPGYLTDATQVSLLLGILLQETKGKTRSRHQESARRQFPQILVPRSSLGPGEEGWGRQREPGGRKVEGACSPPLSLPGAQPLLPPTLQHGY